MELLVWVDELYEHHDRLAHEIMRRIAEVAIMATEQNREDDDE